MGEGREVAFDLLGRLLAGEGDCVPLYLGMLLEKSIRALNDNAQDYSWILPPELLEVELSRETIDEIEAVLCTEIAKDPREELISVATCTGSWLGTKTIAQVLANPPRAVTLGEWQVALGRLRPYLPIFLEEDPEFLPPGDLERLIAALKELQMVEDESVLPSLLYGIRHHVDPLLEWLTREPGKTKKSRLSGAWAARRLLSRVLAGQREDAAFQLGKLLEKSSSGADTVYHYRKVLPLELAELELSPKVVAKVVAALIAEYQRSPDEGIFLILCRSFSEEAVEVIAKTLASPPRPLTMVELREALDRLSFVLPFSMLARREMLSSEEKSKIVLLLEGLHLVDSEETDRDRVRVGALAGTMLAYVTEWRVVERVDG